MHIFCLSAKGVTFICCVMPISLYGYHFKSCVFLRWQGGAKSATCIFSQIINHDFFICCEFGTQNCRILYRTRCACFTCRKFLHRHFANLCHIVVLHGCETASGNGELFWSLVGFTVSHWTKRSDRFQHYTLTGCFNVRKCLQLCYWCYRK